MKISKTNRIKEKFDLKWTSLNKRWFYLLIPAIIVTIVIIYNINGLKIVNEDVTLFNIEHGDMMSSDNDEIVVKGSKHGVGRGI